MKPKTAIVQHVDISSRIIALRQHQVILDADLAKLYGITTKRLKEQVKRNINRFPPDFMFILTRQEVINLRSQFATSSSTWGGTRHLPMAFTEHGALMAANVLNPGSERCPAYKSGVSERI